MEDRNEKSKVGEKNLREKRDFARRNTHKWNRELGAGGTRHGHKNIQKTYFFLHGMHAKN